MLSESRHRQVNSSAPRILLISKESIVTQGLKAGNSGEIGAGAAPDRPTHSRFAAGLATRVERSSTPVHRPRNPPVGGHFHDLRHHHPDPGPHGLAAPAGQAARR